MGFLDAFRWPKQAEPADSAGPPSPSELLSDAVPSTSGGGAEALGAYERATPQIPGLTFPAEGGNQRLYNPYEGIGAVVDGRKGGTVGFRLPTQPEFLFSEEATVHHRSWSENLTYYTGTGYLSGALLGGGQGAAVALRSRPEWTGGSDTSRLRLNRLLNQSGKTGRAAGNALGVLGLFFASFESGFGYLNDARLPDWSNTVGAGFITGAIYRSTRGPKLAAVSGAVGAAAATALVAARKTLNKNL